MAPRSATHSSLPVPSAHSGVSFYKYEIVEDMNSSGQVPHTFSDELEVQWTCDPASFHLPYIHFRFVLYLHSVVFLMYPSVCSSTGCSDPD